MQLINLDIIVEPIKSFINFLKLINNVDIHISAIPEGII